MGELEDAPQLIGRYELLTRLATGGMAELFLARERGLAGLERIVVVKRILPHLADQESFVEMFLREARIVARLSHPNVVQIYELGQESQTYHIAMEYIHGSTVRELLLLAQKQGRVMPIDVATTIAEQSCRGLHAAHELCDLDGQPLGLVHRDVSPHNLMCTTDGHVKLLDFGVAKSTSASVEATYSGNLKGKFAYLSPEQCLHEPLDRRSDVFAMGIVMWEMCTMRRLFKRKTELEMMQSITGGKVPEPKKFRPDLPDPIQEVIMRALAVDRNDRFESAEAMRRALSEASQASGLSIDEGPVVDFMDEVAGERLAERQATVESACERKLTGAERRRLLHMTGSTSSRSMSQIDEDGPTIVERPGEVGSTQQTAADEIRERAERARTSTGSQSVSETETAAHDGETTRASRSGTILNTALITVLVGVILAFFFIDFDKEEQEPVAEEMAVIADGEEDSGSSPEEPDEEPPIEVSGEPIPIGWPPTIDLDVLAEEVAPLHRYLEKATGRPIPKVFAEDYTTLAEMLNDGEVAAAMLPPTLYVLAGNHYEDVEILVMKEFDGTVSSDGYLLTRRNDMVNSVAALEGETFCFVDPASTSGHLLPRAYLRRNGYEPEEFVGAIHWSGDHFQGIRDLIDGKCRAAAVYSGAHATAEGYGIPTSQVSLLGVTGRLPQDVVAVTSAIDEEDRQLLLEALSDFDPQEEFGLNFLGQNQRITGFVVRGEDDFSQLRTVVEEEGLKFSDL